MKIIADAIKAAAKSKGLNINELAERLNLSYTGFSTKINRNITVEGLEEIAKALQMSLADLLSFVPGRSATPEDHERPENGLKCPRCGQMLYLTMQAPEEGKE